MFDHKLRRLITHFSGSLLLILFCLSAVTSVLALRNNNTTMVRLRQAVFDADKNNANVEPALQKLRQYVYGHMNTDLSGGNEAIKLPIQLTFSYDRAVVVEKDRVVQTNAKVAADAQKFCEQKLSTGFFGATRVACIEQYTAEHGVKENPVSLEYYTFNFISPYWTFDFAGVSILTSAFLLLLLAIKVVGRSVKKHKFSI